MKTFTLYLFALIYLGGIGAMYGGIGWCVAWVLDKALDVNVNYEIFVWVGVGIFLIKAIPLLIVKIIHSKAKKEFEKGWEDWKF